jgi:hypothetical protein
MAQSYILTEKTKQILEGKRFILICKRCKEPIEVGQKVHPVYGKNRISGWYHETPCFEDMRI